MESEGEVGLGVVKGVLHSLSGRVLVARYPHSLTTWVRISVLKTRN